MQIKLAKNNQVVSIKKHRRVDSWNIGMVVFAIILLYLLATIITYVTKERIAVYEVRQGSILQDNSYTAMVLRNEELICAENSGYVNYFTESGQKIAVRNKVYTLSNEELETETISEDEEDEQVSLTSEELHNIQQKVQNFNKTFHNEEFNSTVSLQEETASIIKSKSSQNRVVKLNSIVKNSTDDSLKVYKAKQDGIIQLSMDGMEDVKLEDITPEMLSKANYTKTEWKNNTKVAAGSPVYRLINDEKWTIVFPLTKDMKDSLKEQMGERSFLNLDIRFLKDNEIMRGALLIYEKNKKEAYGYIEFSTAMIRYAQDRYLDIELILKNEKGLKIPKSSVVEKEFYVISDEYLTSGGASKELGVFRQTVDKSGDTITEFVAVDVFYKDEVKGLAYIKPDELEAGDRLIMPESTQTTSLSQTDVLEGVYCINKGYAVFKRIDILCESEEYYIIEEGSSYGLSNYDRIALDGTSVVEEQIVNQ